VKSASVFAGLGLVSVLAIAGQAQAAGAEVCQGRASGTKLTVQVSGVRTAKGEMAITVYPDDELRFLAPHGKLLRIRAVAQAPVTTACFWMSGSANYEVTVYHDENANQHFDRALTGMPTEGFGFSNNPPTPMALPPFKATRVAVGGADTRINIRLRYAH
jgi:uncharacterized protein (DUF2141 family)